MAFWKAVEIDNSSQIESGYMSTAYATKEAALERLRSLVEGQDGKTYAIAETDDSGALVKLLDAE
jgi:hypothetical protein